MNADYTKKMIMENLINLLNRIPLNKITVRKLAEEFEILWLLMEKPDDVHNMDEIHYRIWKDEVLSTEVNPVMVHIRRIRSKFEKHGISSIIKTIWGVGYKINA